MMNSSYDNTLSNNRETVKDSFDDSASELKALREMNNILKGELASVKLRVQNLLDENMKLKQASVFIQAKAEQEEEYISNTLFKKIQTLKKEKENLARHCKLEEECLTNELTRNLIQVRNEKKQLENCSELAQGALVDQLMRRIEQLESHVTKKQLSMEQLRREKIELENTVEQEQELLVNKLYKKMEKLEVENKFLKSRLIDQQYYSDSLDEHNSEHSCHDSSNQSPRSLERPDDQSEAQANVNSSESITHNNSLDHREAERTLTSSLRKPDSVTDLHQTFHNLSLTQNCKTCGRPYNTKQGKFSKEAPGSDSAALADAGYQLNSSVEAKSSVFLNSSNDVHSGEE